MSRASVFLDSGIFIAFYDAADAHHEDALRLFAEPPPDWSTSIAIVAETYGWFLHRLGEDAARSFRVALGALPHLRLLHLDLDHHAAVLRKLERLRGNLLTYVDASILVFLGQRRIATVWGTDADLGLEGARVVPGPRLS